MTRGGDRLGRIFDFHARLGPDPAAPDRLLSAMEASGISRAVVCSGGVISLDRLATQVMAGGHSTDDADNAAIVEACLDTGGRLVPFFFGNPHAGADRYDSVAADFLGLELSPAVHGVSLLDARNLALVEVAAEHGHPIYVVCVARPAPAHRTSSSWPNGFLGCSSSSVTAASSRSISTRSTRSATARTSLWRHRAATRASSALRSSASVPTASCSAPNIHCHILTSS